MICDDDYSAAVAVMPDTVAATSTKSMSFACCRRAAAGVGFSADAAVSIGPNADR